jgi:uncharacterized protein (DUF58 family)
VSSEPSDATTAPGGGRLSQLLSNQLIARLERLRVQSLRKVANRGRGEQLAGRGGSSIDFADYRDYTPGDDLRFVDWNIFSRLERPYLKLFRREEERHLVILIDISRSMSFDDKLLRARELAAGFSVVGLHAHDLVSVWAVDGAHARRFGPAHGRGSMRRALLAIEGIQEAASTQPIEQSIQTMLAHHRGRGIAVLLSDFLTEGDLRKSLNLLTASGLEPALIQILGASEVDPDLNGDVRLVDCESAGVLDVSAAGDLLSLYHQYRLAYQKQLSEWCSVRQGRFLSISSADQAEVLLGDVLRRRGWLA